MKNLSIALNIILCVAVIILFVDRFSGSKGSHAGKVGETGEEAIIAYVNMDSLLNNCDLYNEQKTQLIQKQQQHESDLGTKAKALERRQAELQQKYDQKLITTKQAQAESQALAAEQQSFIQTRDQLSLELQQDNQNMMKQIYDNVNSFLGDYTKDHKYKVVINNATLLYGNKTLDITSDVIKGVNKKYNSANKSKTDKK